MSIKIENTVKPSAEQWLAAILGARNAMNSWDRSDSKIMNTVLKEEEVCSGVTSFVNNPCEPYISIGPNDWELLTKLAKGGSTHAKYRRMLPVIVNITAPLYWWKEADTYKVATVANSCSTMHKIHAFNFDRDDFSCEKLLPPSLQVLDNTITELNFWRNIFINGGHVHVRDNMVIDFDARDKRAWDQMIQLLPSSYNQKRTINLNYEVLVGMYRDRKAHKLNEWRELCKWIEGLPYSELITGEKEKENAN